MNRIQSSRGSEGNNGPLETVTSTPAPKRKRDETRSWLETVLNKEVVDPKGKRREYNIVQSSVNYELMSDGPRIRWNPENDNLILSGVKTYKDFLAACKERGDTVFPGQTTFNKRRGELFPDEIRRRSPRVQWTDQHKKIIQQMLKLPIITWESEERKDVQQFNEFKRLCHEKGLTCPFSMEQFKSKMRSSLNKSHMQPSLKPLRFITVQFTNPKE
ncbi:MAG: hypothetical protein ON057_001666 [Glomeribacter sp. 1016415]|nr:hypothetical protein [Glomeribacter sp. 1016415]